MKAITKVTFEMHPRVFGDIHFNAKELELFQTALLDFITNGGACLHSVVVENIGAPTPEYNPADYFNPSDWN